MHKAVFPENFLWGAATASAQIEGGYNEGGRTPSIWDIAPKEKIKSGDNCRIACDHYHRYRDDVALMKKIGLKSYRFSISWSRVVHEEGKVNQKGLDFYNDLINELICQGIEPIVTLYHWDLPLWVYKKGGWLKHYIIEDFDFYTKTIVEAFSDRVKYWITFNEPSCFLMNGYMQGVHAPFERRYLALTRFSKIFMRTNHRAVETIRKYAKKKPLIGLSFAAGAFIPKNEKDRTSISRARRQSFYQGMGTMNNRWWMDPILLGNPVFAYGIYHINNRFAQRVKTDFDFLAVNHYEAFNYSLWGGEKNLDRSNLRTTSMGWVIDGRSIYWTLKFLYERYGLPIFITENGMANDDKVIDGKVNDQIRSDFMDEYLKNVKRAIGEGIPVLGYLHWSLMDNFEWAEGYAPRFGLIHIDYATMERTIKNSAYHYKQIIDTNGECL